MSFALDPCRSGQFILVCEAGGGGMGGSFGFPAADERLQVNPLSPVLGEIDPIPASQLELFGKSG